tara:strand:+ start:1257 stop:2969 length:1713 start_codon:yes stop_codon:yes gene_type:complete
MIKKHLITNFCKLKFKKNSHLIFENEYLKKLFNEKELKNYKCSSLETLDQVYNRKIDFIFCKRKAKRYLSEFFPTLNTLNNSKLKKDEWAILIEYFLLISIIYLKRRIETFKKIKDKKNIFIEAYNHNFFFENCSIYKIKQLEDIEFNRYTNYLLAKKFQLKIVNYSNSKNFFFFDKNNKTSVFKKMIYFFYNSLTFFFKPIIIFDGYFGKKNALKVFFKSRFQILFANIDFLKLSKKKIFTKKNKYYRSRISLKIEDDFDVIYNEFVKNVLPSSYLENFATYYQSNTEKYDKLSKIGTAIHIAANDYFKFATLNLKKKNKKIFNLQHGGLFGNKVFAPENYVNTKFSDLNLYWNDKKKKIGSPYFLDFNFKTSKFTNKILFFPCHQLFFEEIENVGNNNHIYLNQYLSLINQLNIKKFSNLSVKFFNHKNDDLLKKIWIKNFGKKIEILDSSNSYKGNIFKNYDLVIIDDFSTAFYELMYYKKPFIILNSAASINFKKKFWLKLKELKKINLWFDNEKKLASFLENNFENFILNWEKTINSQPYIKLKKNLFSTERFNDSLFVKNILKL